MTIASEKIIQAIEFVVKPLSVGTNIALLHVLWAMVSGTFLDSRGAVHTALKLSGRSDKETRRSSTALRKGQWQISELIDRWRTWVEQTGEWKVREYEGWRAVSCDVVVFPRLSLKGWEAKLYRGIFGKAIKAVGLGIIVDIGQYEGKRAPLLRKIVRCQNSKESEKQLKLDLLREAACTLQDNEVFVHDAGVGIKEVQQAKITHYVIRLAKNCVARWPYLPENAHGNRQCGDYIRPLARTRKGVETAASNDPTLTTKFEYQGRTIKASCWENVVGSKDKVADEAETYHIWVFLTRCIQSHLSWGQMCLRRQTQFSNSTVTVGQLNNCP